MRASNQQIEFEGIELEKGDLEDGLRLLIEKIQSNPTDVMQTFSSLRNVLLVLLGSITLSRQASDDIRQVQKANINTQSEIESLSKTMLLQKMDLAIAKARIEKLEQTLQKFEQSSEKPETSLSTEYLLGLIMTSLVSTLRAEQLDVLQGLKLSKIDPDYFELYVPVTKSYGTELLDIIQDVCDEIGKKFDIMIDLG